jgi:glycosyltransferase involved in cell wall biosynthesis/predicted Zn-dependent protease
VEKPVALRYLFGPVESSFSNEQLQRLRAEGECLSFGGPGTDLPLQPDDSTWEQFAARLPSGWAPDFVALWLNYTVVPDFLWSAPVPLVGLAPDWNLLWHAQRRLLPRCDAVVSDAPGVILMGHHGIRHALPGVLFGCPDSFLTQPPAASERDIHILFVGNTHPAVQVERLPWLARIARLGDRWNVVVTSGVYGAEYRALLARSRIVFNRSLRGEFNQRVAETLASGALLFQEVGNREVESCLQMGRDYVAYEDATLEARLEHYLRHEEERLAIARAGQARAAEVTFTAQWRTIVGAIQGSWPTLQRRLSQRPRPTVDELLTDRVWQGLSSTSADPPLLLELESALRYQADDPTLLAGSALAHYWANRSGRAVRPEGLQHAIECLDRALRLVPGHPLLGLGLAEALAALGQREPAVLVASQTLAALDRDQPLARPFWDVPPFAPIFDHFRVQWERAAWQGGSAGLLGEVLAKREVLRWRLHGLLAELAEGEAGLEHAYEEALTRPDLPVSRATLGCALARAGRFHHALPHLRAAVLGNPWDAQALRALHGVLHEVGDGVAAGRVAQEARRLHAAAPRLLPAQPWTNSEEEIPEHRRNEPVRVVWEGAFRAAHSLALVNHNLTDRLGVLGHSIARLPAGPEDAPARQASAESSGTEVEVHVSHFWPARTTPPEKGRWVFYQPWEFGSIPRLWVETLAPRVDEFWVPSHFVRDCCLQGGLHPDLVHVVSPGTDPQRFHPDAEPTLLPGRRAFAFLFVGATIHRKGIDLLLEAYARAFRPDEDVCLVIKDVAARTVYRGQTAEGLIQRYQSSGRTAPILHLTDDWTDERLAGLYAACDCLVLPYRGEGFGLPIIEAMATARPVIVPAHGPALEICAEDTAYFVPARTVRLPEAKVGDLELVAPGWFGEVDVDSLRATLRHVHDHRDEARARGQVGRARVLGRWTWDHSVAAVERRLRVLAERPARRQGRSASGRPWLECTSPPLLETIPTDLLLRARQAKVTLCLIVRNEETNLRACVEPLLDLFDEIIINDTGSTDGTVPLAKSLGSKVKVIENRWQDSFSVARNQCLEAAAGDWIFWMDADDRLDAENIQKLAHLFASLKPEMVGYTMRCLCLPDQERGQATLVDHLRLFPNRPGVRWEFRVHEQILPALNEQGAQHCWTDIVIHHTGYQDPALRRRKLDRDRALLELELRDRPDHPYALFNLGSILQELGQHRQAIPVLRRSLERSDPGDSIVRKLYALLAGSHRALGERDVALSACRAGLRLIPDDSELLFLQGQTQLESGDAAGAVRSLLALVEGQPALHFGSRDPSLRGQRGRQLLAEALASAGDAAGAEEQYRRVLGENPTAVGAWRGLGRLLIQQGRWLDVERAAAELERLGDEVGNAIVLGRSLLARKEFAAARTLLEGTVGRHPAAVGAWVTLSYVLLQEGRDLRAAEGVLLKILELDPGDDEARSNLNVLRRSLRR